MTGLVSTVLYIKVLELSRFLGSGSLKIVTYVRNGWLIIIPSEGDHTFVAVRGVRVPAVDAEAARPVLRVGP